MHDYIIHYIRPVVWAIILTMFIFMLYKIYRMEGEVGILTLFLMMFLIPMIFNDSPFIHPIS